MRARAFWKAVTVDRSREDLGRPGRHSPRQQTPERPRRHRTNPRDLSRFAIQRSFERAGAAGL